MQSMSLSSYCLEIGLSGLRKTTRTHPTFNVFIHLILMQFSHRSLQHGYECTVYFLNLISKQSVFVVSFTTTELHRIWTDSRRRNRLVYLCDALGNNKLRLVGVTSIGEETYYLDLDSPSVSSSSGGSQHVAYCVLVLFNIACMLREECNIVSFLFCLISKYLFACVTIKRVRKSRNYFSWWVALIVIRFLMLRKIAQNLTTFSRTPVVYNIV